MAISKIAFLTSLFLLTISIVAIAQESSDVETSKPSKKWLARAESELLKLKGDEQCVAAQAAIFELGGALEADAAETIMQTYVPLNLRTSCLCAIAGAKTESGEFEGSLKTIAEMPTGVLQQAAIQAVAVGRARHGEIEKAEELLPRIESEELRDDVYQAIVTSHAVTGKLDAARDAAKSIVNDEKRKQSVESLESLRIVPLGKIRSRFLRVQVHRYLPMSDEGGKHETVAAILDAQRNDRQAVAEHIKEALAKSGEFDRFYQSQIKASLALALAESNQHEAAAKMLRDARKALGLDWYQASHVFGSPLLAYLFIRLEMNEEFLEMRKSMGEKDPVDRIPHYEFLRAIGRAYTYLDKSEKAEQEYRNFKTPSERIHFAIGAYIGLRDREHVDD